MDESSFQQPTDEQLAAFVLGDPVAENEVLQIVLPQLYRWAAHHYPTLPQPEVESVINQVVSETCRPHVRYNPQKAKLTTYLIGLIKLRVVDLFEKQNAINDIHEKMLHLPYNQLVVNDVDIRLTRETFFQEVRPFLNSVESEFLELMKDGEKSLDAFAAILSRHGALVDPSKEVKNTKERLQRKLKAFARDRNYQIDDLLEG